MYLNENCKNAMNLEDFIKKITISLQDLDYTKNYMRVYYKYIFKTIKRLSPSEDLFIVVIKND